MNQPIVKVAAAQYPVDSHENWQSFSAKIRRWVEEAAAADARVLLFPEYLGFEITSIFRRIGVAALADQMSELQGLEAEFIGLFSECARQTGAEICAGTFPVRIDTGKYRNRSFFFRPDGSLDFQDKLQMTPFERRYTDICPGSQIKTLGSAFGKAAINVCYDSEFPLFARRQAEAEALLVLVPSCTDTLAGYQRVRIGCRARALENQLYVAQSVLIGRCAWSEMIDENTGAAGIYGPVDNGFPDDGCIAEGVVDQPGWVYGDLDLHRIGVLRQTGHTTNFHDWETQYRFL
ncbi:MAG: carbon-nitrogen hydrolase family protein [Methylococcaceae bacterium]|nr:carbon-nitrogen hydrolase family protein [Methylococcaceae bacterium]